jgi:glutathione S-transferase
VYVKEAQRDAALPFAALTISRASAKVASTAFPGAKSDGEARKSGKMSILLDRKPARVNFRLFWRYVTSVHPGPATFPGLMAHYQRILARRAVQRTWEIEAAIGNNLSGAGETRG